MEVGIGVDTVSCGFAGDPAASAFPSNGTIGDNNPYYAFEGYLDEVRISNVARGDFPIVR